MKKLLATAILTLTTAGLVGLPTTAAHADDFRQATGTCSNGAKFTMKLRDAGDDPDRLRASFFIDSDKSDRFWRVQFKRGGSVIARVPQRTKGNGNLFVSRTFRGDDDARVTVFAKSGYGETCRRVLTLDD